MKPDQPAPEVTPQERLERQVARQKEAQQNQEVLKQAREMVKNQASREVRTDIIREALQDIRAFIPEYNPPPGLRKVASGWYKIVHLSDWHIGQMTEAGSTGGLYYHNIDVATQQIERMKEIERAILRDSGKVVERTLIVVNGDMVDGDDMRNSQHRDIEMLVTEQTMKCLRLLISYIQHEAEITEGDVVVSFVGGNHDRTSRKAGNAGLGELGYTDTYAWMMGEMLKMLFEGNERITILNHDTFFGMLEFEGFRIVHSHGADVNWSAGSYGGVPWYGIMNAVNQYRAMTQGDFDLLMLAHGHQPAMIQNGDTWVNMNGSLPGTSTFVQSKFKAIRTPIQWVLMLNEHGLVDQMPLYLDVGQREKDEDAIWQSV